MTHWIVFVFILVVVALGGRLGAADLIINAGTSAMNEAGIVFQLTNTNPDAIVRLRGVFMMATNGGEPQQFDWYAADGHLGFVDGVFGQPVQGGPHWRLVASCVPTHIEDSDEPGSPHTVLTFNQSLDIQPGRTVTMAIVQTKFAVKTIKYMSDKHDYVPADGLVYAPYVGLGSPPPRAKPADLTSPEFSMQQFGTPGQRSFIGRINYVVLPKNQP